MEPDSDNLCETACAHIGAMWSVRPRAVVILGTGLGRLVDFARHDAVVPYTDLPGFARATALGHRGRLICGWIQNTPVLLLDGRCHRYEGYSWQQVTLPVRLAHACGATLLIATNASGGLNPDFATGDVMVIADHINMMTSSVPPLTASTPCGRAVPSAPSPYDERLITRSLEVAQHRNFVAHRGVYVAMTGPNYETRAEYRFLRLIGGDAVGMSTVPEVDLARMLGMRAFGLSIITNVASPDAPQVVQATEVVDAAEHAEPYVRAILAEIVGEAS
jgi:purine-nucleoside phosphorylase